MFSLRGIGLCLVVVGMQILVLFVAGSAQARWLCVDPATDHDAEDRLCEETARSLDTLLLSGSVQPGDRILLKAGKYGDLAIRQRRNDRLVTIAAYPEHEAVFSSILIEDSSNWAFSEITIEPLPGTKNKGPLFQVSGESRSIVLKDSRVRAAPSVEKWTRQDWLNNARTGVRVEGRGIKIERVEIENVRHGIESLAHVSRFIGNTINRFSGDGIRGLGDGAVYAENTIKNCYDIDDNHDDGFQSWSLDANNNPGGGVVRNGVLSGNFIIGYEDPGQPYKCRLQGIGMFDGFFENWIIEGNIVLVDNWHGITVMGGRNVRITNNVVVDQNTNELGPPWISITSHKDGRSSEGSDVSRNLIQLQQGLMRDGFGYSFSPYQTGVTYQDNILVTGKNDVAVRTRIEDWPRKHYNRVLKWSQE